MASGGRIAELEAEVAELRAALAARPPLEQGGPAAFLSALLEAMPAFILRTDSDLRLRYINRVQPGTSRQDVIGRSIWDFVAPEAQETAHRCVMRALETGIGDVYERAASICRRTFDRHIVIDCAIADDLPRVFCSDGEVEQILMNILLNARDAVLTSKRPTPHIRIAVDQAPPPGHESKTPLVRIRIEDEGIGMSEDVLARVFDPFFTTKPVGVGTGLGLLTSYAIARELGGMLTCTTEEGAGATFTVYLPPSDAPPGGDAEPASEVASRATPQARVLIVDDEAPIRRAVTLVLSDSGFSIESASSGDEAVTRLASEPRIDVVLLDRSMPGAPGETFLPRMRALAPEARIIVFSGQAIEPELARAVDGVVVKPASMRELVAAITAALQRPPR